MTFNPEIGQAKGPQYDLPKAIKSFLGQMAEGKIILGAAVIKELMQNADDAGATEMTVLLDERPTPFGPENEFHSLTLPALLVRNNAPFKKNSDPDCEGVDDFEALCTIATGHKQSQFTAAGRFGIGFNSVYFFTDTPVIFSRREVHIFDPVRHIFNHNGWRFPLDDFPSSASSAGPIKNILSWSFPTISLKNEKAFGEIAGAGEEYRQAVLRLPLRQSVEGSKSLYSDCFQGTDERLQLLKEMSEQAEKSILFLKFLNRIEFAILNENGLNQISEIVITPNPEIFVVFLSRVKEESSKFEGGDHLKCGFYERSINVNLSNENNKALNFCVKHSARFDDDETVNIRKKLHKNDERAIPWVSMAIPKDTESLKFDGSDTPAWRVFLPLLEKGPCGCVLNGEFFVGPSRQRAAFRSDGSDEALRKTRWNKALIEHVLVPMMRDASLELIELIPELVKEHPHEYLNLFPAAPKKKSDPEGITEFLQQIFSAEPWYLKCYDLWDEELELLVGEENDISLEMIPQALVGYQDRFQHLSEEKRRFISWRLGEAIRNRLDENSSIEVKREESIDVVRQILGWEKPPKSGDLTDLVQRLARRLGQEAVTKSELADLWALRKYNSEDVLQYKEEVLYVLVGEKGSTEIHQALQELGLGFENTVWVDATCGLPALSEFLRQDFDNLVKADDYAALELLKRVQGGAEHDRISQSRLIETVIDFLCKQEANRLSEDLRLGFLIKTAANKQHTRNLGTIFLKPKNPKFDDKAIWEGLLRRTFAEVDPQFMPHIQRLIDHAPNMLDCMHASNCQLRIAHSGHLLDALHHAVELSEDACGKFQEELNRAQRDQNDCRPEAYRTTRLILDEAMDRWADLGEDQQLTVLALPIHRAANGRLISLVDQVELDSFAQFEDAVQTVRNRFYLQSEDDLQDAPIVLPERRLLRSEYALYRQQLRIDSRDRCVVVRECLKQIGDEQVDNHKLLAYIAKYYGDVIESLNQDGSEIAKDEVQELQEIYQTSKIVPCIDGSWKSYDECVAANDMAEALQKQGWKGQDLDALLTRLAYPQAVASRDGKLIKMIRQLDLPLENLTSYDIPVRAVTSEDLDFALGERAGVIVKNWAVLPQRDFERANVIGELTCRALGGTVAFEALELIDVHNLSLPVSVLRSIFPNAADISALAIEWEIKEGEVRDVLRLFRVLFCGQAAMNERLCAHFVDLWPDLKNDDRFAVLKYIGSRQDLGEQLEEQTEGLDVVFVQVDKGRWAEPEDVLTPKWAQTDPPNLPSERLPKITDIDPDVQKLWNAWCGLAGISQVIEAVVQGTGAIPAAKRKKAWQDLVVWLEKISKGNDRKAAIDRMNTLPWVLARKEEEVEFKLSSETIRHPGGSILAQAYWVVDGTLPGAIAEDLEFQELGGTIDTVCEVGRCLVGAVTSSRTAIESVYKLVADLIEQDDELAEVWRNNANTKPVYRLFRQPELMVSGQALFVGNREYPSDYGDVLFCFSAREKEEDAFFKRIKGLYRKLGVEDRPSIAQTASALSRLKGNSKKLKPLYDQLVKMITGTDPTQSIDDIIEWGNIRVLACSGTFEPLANVYRHAIINRAQLLSVDSRRVLMNDRERNTRQLIRWLENIAPDEIQDLDKVGRIELVDEPEQVEIASSASLNIGPWEDWFDQLAAEASEVRGRVGKHLESAPPSLPFRLMPVEKLSVKYILPDEQEVNPSSEWEGPPALWNGDQTVFVLQNRLEVDYLGGEDALDELDRAIADQVLALMDEEAYEADAFWEIVQETLERPNVILDRMRKVRQEHFFHQYHDQTADPEFSRVFDVYLRTAKNAQDKRRQLEQEMFDIIRGKFVQERRSQIRGYGYDEFSIFAELIQNAEDAYLQREIIGLEAPPQRNIAFTYQEGQDGERCLVVEYYGRPFNYWRHDGRKIENYGRDVEGVLKSAGSFKPHVLEHDEGRRPVGRFGLGFKSVYLITDCPRIHSGQWHFEIESGCIPNPLPIPEDLPEGATRILLPLSDEAQEEFDEEGDRFITFIPFLAEIQSLKLTNTDGSERVLKTKVSNRAEAENGIFIELVEISGISYVRGEVLRMLRFRASGGPQQLGIYIAPDNLPANWDDAFDKDTFAVLPLNVHLGCGVGVSHHFELQSGRTHLIDPEGNRPLYKEVAELLAALPEALKLCQELGADQQNITNQFWSFWRWDLGDLEAKELRQALAEALVNVSQVSEVVPTLYPNTCVALDGSPVFLFRDIPFLFAEDLMREAIEVPFEDQRVPLSPDKVVPEAFGKAYRQVCRVAGQPIKGLQEIGWTDIGQVMIDRAWFAKKPELLAAMARCIEDDDFEKIKGWLSLCPLRASDGSHDFASNLLSPDFSGYRNLPARKMRLLDINYNQDAVALLRRVGLPAGPSIQTIEDWIEEGLSQEECIGLLHYLQGERRWMRSFFTLQDVLQEPWFDSGMERLTTDNAWKARLIPEELVEDTLFCTWLGIQDEEDEEAEKRPIAEIDPGEVLEKIYTWWEDEGAEWIEKYEKDTYPGGSFPSIEAHFFQRDRDQRQAWLSLFLLGCMHTMGRAEPGQHRNFLHMCEQRGWLTTFAEENAPATKWMGILEGYLEEQVEQAEYYHWMRQFVGIFQMSRWLNDYVDVFLGIERRPKPFSLHLITRPRADSDLGGGGPDGPPITRALGIGACFVFRELRRNGILTNPLANPHCFVPVRRVRDLFAQIGCDGVHFESGVGVSVQMHDFLVQYLGPDQATFNNTFDLPFLTITNNPSLRQKFFGTVYVYKDAGGLVCL